jgi:Uma2 family endonuclease
MGMPKEVDRLYTHQDLENFPDDEIWELLEGVPYQMTPPSEQHERIATELFRQFANYLLDKPCEVYSAQFGVYLPNTRKKNNFVVPDLMVVCEKFTGPKYYGIPSMVIEIVSPSNQLAEMQKKYMIYQNLGVREYWLVYPENKTLVVHKLNQNNRFELVDCYDEADEDFNNPQIKVGIFDYFSIDMRLVFREKLI